MSSQKTRRIRIRTIAAIGILTMAAITEIPASSHREAPAITKSPKLDATDFYMFNSYETGRDAYVTLVANYIPLQDAYGGPNYFTLDPDAVYDIKIDNNGDAKEDLIFRFETVGRLKDHATGDARFVKPVDNIGQKTIPNYDAYANQYVYAVDIPGCATSGRLFVGQRKDPFVVNLGETFDLVNIAAPIGAIDAEDDDLADKNVTAMVLEVPKACLVSGPANPVIGAWIAASVKPKEDDRRSLFRERPVQASRLSAPLVNEVVIGLKDKDRFNASEPKDDVQFLDYVTHPTLPALLEILFGAAGVRAPTQFPRTDLIAAFLTGLDGLNKTRTPAEMLRLNTSIAAKPAAEQSNLGALGGDLAGFPNGRRPGDDVVDIELRVAMGALLPPAAAPSGALAFTDGAFVDASFFDVTFPYLKTPTPGSPGELNGR